MDISVVIPTYNRAASVQRAIQSVLTQTSLPREVIVVDDGSTDNTVPISSGRFPGIKIVSQSNLGVSAARNHGINLSSSRWVAFLDSDDEWQKDKLEMQIQKIRENPGCLACHCDEIWIRHGRRVNPMKKHAKPSGWIFEHCLPLCRVSPSAVLLNKLIFENVGLFDERLPVCEDYDMWLRIFSRYPISFVNKRLVVKYGGHTDQLSRRYWGMDRFRVKALVKILTEGHLSRTQFDKARAALLEKLAILIRGFDKRSDYRSVEEYTALYHYWADRSCW